MKHASLLVALLVVSCRAGADCPVGLDPGEGCDNGASNSNRIRRIDVDGAITTIT